MSKVVSFSLFGSSQKYLTGAIENCKRVAEVMPGWEAWFYCGTGVPQEVLVRLEVLGGRVIRVDDAEDQSATLWRFRPLLEERVSLALSRDADSLISTREANLVRAWELSGKDMHVIRDHADHIWHMPAGLVGLRNTSAIRRAVARMLEQVAMPYYGIDADLLYWHIWRNKGISRRIDDSLAFSSLVCIPHKAVRHGGDFCGRVAFGPSGEFVLPLHSEKANSSFWVLVGQFLKRNTLMAGEALRAKRRWASRSGAGHA